MLFTFFVFIGTAWANPWEYRITNMDTPGVINYNKTTATVDTINNEIRLPYYAPNTVAFWPDGSADYVVLSPTRVIHFSWDGTKMVDNIILEIPNLSNPLALAAPAPYPDVVVADPTGTKYYSFAGTQMIENPALSVAGMSNVIAIGARDTTIAGLVGDEVHVYTGGVKDATLEPTVSLSNPIGLALYPDQSNMAVLENNQARFFMHTGTQMVESPGMAITGIINPKAISAGDNFNTAIITGNEALHYSFDGSELKYNSVLSVTSGLTNPTSIALRPGSYDRIVVDGDQVKYYLFNEATGQLVYDAARSQTVAGLSQLGGFATVATVTSQVFNPGHDVKLVRVRAHHVLPVGTSVTWSYTNNGLSFTPVWRVRNDNGTTYCETTVNGTDWTSIGDADVASPSQDAKELWAEFVTNNKVAWRADLATTNFKATPKIKAPSPGGVAVLWEAGNPLSKPILDIPSHCYTTTTPTFEWGFENIDPGDGQTGYQVVIRKLDTEPVFYSGVINSSEQKFNMPTSQAPESPGYLWTAGDYEFTIEVQAFNIKGIPSQWSDPKRFCIVGFERPRVQELAGPGTGQVAPDKNTLATHILIKEGATEEELPVTKAGGKVGILVDSIGPITSLSAVFPYRGTSAEVYKTECISLPGSRTNRWLIEFWTSASADICPDGTVVGMNINGNSSEGNTQLSTVNEPKYAAGIVKTLGSMYGNWFVVLQGSN